MQLKLEQAGPECAEGCEEIFRNSLIYERYFQDPGRLEASLHRAAEQGELYLAVSESGELAGAMRIVMKGFCGLYPYLGGFLMEHLERLAREAGSRRVTLMVSDFNESAQQFYQARGYWRLGVLRDAVKPGIDEFVMVKDLEPV